MINCSGLSGILQNKCHAINSFYSSHLWQIYALVVLLIVVVAIVGRQKLDKLMFRAIDKTLKDKHLGFGGKGEPYEGPKWRLKRRWVFGPIQALKLTLPAGKDESEIIQASNALSACLGRGVRFTEPEIHGQKVTFHVRSFK